MLLPCFIFVRLNVYLGCFDFFVPNKVADEVDVLRLSIHISYRRLAKVVALEVVDAPLLEVSSELLREGMSVRRVKDLRIRPFPLLEAAEPLEFT